jgi:hypothetical protein
LELAAVSGRNESPKQMYSDGNLQPCMTHQFKLIVLN